MRKIILYIASSKDGFIARENGDIDWLIKDSDEDFGYSDLLNSIDTTLMGGKTYRQILTFGDFPYKDKKNYVFTRNKQTVKSPYVQFVNENITGFARDLLSRTGKDIWLIGGSEIIAQFFKAKLIDELILFEQNIILGSGIPLLSKETEEIKMNFISEKVFKDGHIQTHYSIFK